MIKESKKAHQHVLAAAMSHGNEDDIKVKLAHALHELGYEASTEFQIGKRQVDLYLLGRRVLIECKAPGTVDPDAKRGAETQYEQLRWYVTQQRVREAKELELFQGVYKPLDWIGILTDACTTYIYKWDHRPDSFGHIGEPQILQNSDELYRLFASFSDIHDGSLPLVPRDPSKIFMGKEQALTVIWRKVQDLRHARTQRQMWEVMLDATGMKPEDTHSAEILFIQHCFLVSVARCVSNAMRPDSQPEAVDKLTHGYINWITKDNQAGTDWFTELQNIVATYDWRRRQTDVLRILYQNTISREMRKVYGEYYTPDWLAQMLTERVLDDPWCEETVSLALFALRNQKMEVLHGRGVLDPTCGSGTFLYHSAQRLLQSDGLTSSGVSYAERAQAVCCLIHGFDIHPVAVEFSKTNLLRALPAPLTDHSLINIHQGDSLLSEQFQDVMAEGTLEIHTPHNRIFYLPNTFIRRSTFVKEFEHFICAAESQEAQCPPAILFGKGEDEKSQLIETFKQVKIICQEEGNGIWWYHATNLTAPWLLAGRKVDRILANPPWVRMNEIQVDSRKESFTKLAHNLQIWSGGKRATSMDIGGVFVLQCCQNYLQNNEDKTAWLLNDASRKAGSWRKFRDQFTKQLLPTPSKGDDLQVNKSRLGFVTFSDLKGTSAPFKGAASCAWFTGVESFKLMVSLVDVNNKINLQDDWQSVRDKIQYKDVPSESQSKSSEYVDKIGNPVARNGATLFPQALVKVAKVLSSDSRITRGFTGGSTQKSWKEFNQREFEVPTNWIREVVFSSDLLVFCTRKLVTQCILPCTNDGTQLLSEEESLRQLYWRQANSIYEDRKGIARGTPSTLLRNLDHLSKLSSQLSTKSLKWRITYNSSGQNLRASRVSSNIPVEHKCYRIDNLSANEATYIVTILNAETLQYLFQASRESDRDFDTHFWRKVPIPRFDNKNLRHLELVKVGKRCEKTAIRVRDSLPANTKQPKLCKEIRAKLKANGLSQSIDQLVEKIV